MLFSEILLGLFKMAKSMQVAPSERKKMINISRSYMKLVCSISVILIVKIIEIFSY